MHLPCDHDHFERLVMVHRPFVASRLNVAMRNDRERGDEVINRIFAEAWRQWPKYDPMRSKVVTWLGWIAREVIQWETSWYTTNREQFMREMSSLDAMVAFDGDRESYSTVADQSCPDPADVLVWRDEETRRAHALNHAVATLEYPLQRAVQGIMNGKTHSEVGADEGISRQAVSQRITKSIPQLRKAVAEAAMN